MIEINYIEKDGLLYPDLQLPKQFILSRFGCLRKEYLKRHCPVEYTKMLIKGELDEYLKQFDDEMNDLHDCLIKRFQERRNINDILKEKNQLKWAQEMNNIKNAVDEIIINEHICIK